MTSPEADYTVEDARRLVDGLHREPHRPEYVVVGPIGAPVEDRSRFCCTSAGLEDLLARALADDPRCPCARACGWHAELTR